MIKPYTEPDAGTWRYDMENCPQNEKVQLLTTGNIALTGVYRKADAWFYKGWYPLLKRDKAKERQNV